MGCGSSVHAAQTPTSDSQRRRLSMTGGPIGVKVSSVENDARRRRLSIATHPKGDAQKIVDSNQADGKSSVLLSACPAEGYKAEQLPIRWGSISRPGNDPMKRQKENQDTFVVLDRYNQKPDWMFFGVWDGHGPSGALASGFVRDTLPQSWIAAKTLEKDAPAAAAEGCIATNHALSLSSIDVYVSGCTSITSFLRGSTLFTANVGDSRAVLGRVNNQGNIRAVDLSHDHKPDRPDEMARIIKSGGRVFEWGVPRVWLMEVDMPGLAMARSFGDAAAETVGVFAEPELSEVTLSAADKFIIWASDGVWEFISSQDAVNIVAEYIEDSPQRACEVLTETAVKRWNQEEDVVDDITCVIAYLDYK